MQRENCIAHWLYQVAMSDDCTYAGMSIRIRILSPSDPLIFSPPDPDPVLFSTDPDSDPDPTCNNGFIKLFLSWNKYKSESTNSSINDEL